MDMEEDGEVDGGKPVHRKLRSGRTVYTEVRIPRRIHCNQCKRC